MERRKIQGYLVRMFWAMIGSTMGLVFLIGVIAITGINADTGCLLL